LEVFKKTKMLFLKGQKTNQTLNANIIILSLFKSCPPGLGRATKGKTIFTCVYIENSMFLQNQQALSDVKDALDNMNAVN
jgi:hypothetical protein